ncbi:Protein APEM9, partial [Linum grandiflorum]
LYHRVCFQISAGSLNGLKEFLEDFLSKWIFVDGSFYVLGGAGSTIKVHEEGDRRNRLDVETFLAIVEVYAVTLLGKHLKEFNVAVSWLEKAALPEEIRQVMLYFLHPCASWCYWNLEMIHDALMRFRFSVDGMYLMCILILNQVQA